MKATNTDQRKEIDMQLDELLPRDIADAKGRASIAASKAESNDFMNAMSTFGTRGKK